MSKTLIIAEIGINHDGSRQLLRRMIRGAKAAGADIFKTQVYDPGVLFPGGSITAGGVDWFRRVMQTKLTADDIKWLATECDTAGIEFMASCFDFERLQWLEAVSVKRHKVAYRMNQNRKLIDAMTATGKPKLLSAGMNSVVVGMVRRDSLLYCVPKYPTAYNELDFASIFALRTFDGFSDHTVGIGAAIAAVSRGATIIEKHVKPDNRWCGPDADCSVDLRDFGKMVECIRQVEEINLC